MLKVFVFSDVICPWCYLGKRHFERAVEARGLRGSVAIQWLPFELNPEMPRGGMPRAEYRARKFGAQRAAELDARMERLGQEEGVTFAFGRMERTPNTRPAHLLITHAGRRGRADAVVDALFRAYFEEGQDIGSIPVLLDIGTAAGLERAEVAGALDDPGLEAEVTALESRAAELGIGGVPFFILEGGQAISGAQSTEAWLQILDERSVHPAAPRA